MSNENQSDQNRSSTARRLRDKEKFGKIKGLTPPQSETPQDNFTENVIDTTMENLEQRENQKRQMKAVNNHHHPMGILFHAVTDAVGQTYARTPAGKLTQRMSDLFKERRARKLELDAENERNAVATTVVVTGLCTLANHFEKLHIITAPIIWLVNFIGHLAGVNGPIIITKVVSYKKVQYFTVGVQMQYQVAFMVFIAGVSWYISYRIIIWTKNTVLPDERLKM
jgi:hypothetical protein